MSRYSDDYRERQEQRERERREYHREVEYDVWRSGGNMDRVDYDRVQDSYYDGYSTEEAARREIRAQQPRHKEMSIEDMYYAQQPDTEQSSPDS